MERSPDLQIDHLSGYNRSLTIVALLGLFVFFLSGWAARTDFLSLIIPYLLATFCYLILILSQKTIREVHMLIKAGFLIRISLFFFLPNLSDDVYRFWWDGTLLDHGINPFSQTPSEIIASDISPGLKDKLTPVFSLLNSPDYRTVYPPWSQFTCSLAARIAGSDLIFFSAILKFLVLASDLLFNFSVLGILRRLNMDIKNVLIFFLNPLTLLELNGNLHFESWMISLLALSILIWMNGGKKLASIALGASFLSKMISAISLPFFLSRRTPIKKTVGFLLLFLILSASILFMIPFKADSLQGYALYFKIFEFNSSLYFFLREWAERYQWWAFKQATGMITLVLFLIFFLTTSLHSFWTSVHPAKFNFRSAWWVWFAFLILSSTVHPWYILPLLFLGIFSYPITSVFWSLFVFVSYLHYDIRMEGNFHLFRIAEYGLLLIILLWEVGFFTKIIHKMSNRPDKVCALK